MNALKKFARRLRRSTSGNTAILVGLGMPALIGGAGFAVDTAQWYLWKRELQYAADQGALAGAWARGNGDTGTIYQTRATQEFTANLQVTEGYTPTQASSLEDYASGTQNSVVVTASVTASLPFSEFVMGRSATIAVRSQATWETVAAWNPCILAVKPTGSKGIWYNGGPVVNTPCGNGTVSDSAGAVTISGNSGTYDVGFVVTAGTVVDTHDGFANADVIENSEGVFDPFEDLTPPDNPTARTLSCGATSDPWTADETVNSTYSYKYYFGANESKARDGGERTYTGDGRSNLSPETDTQLGETYSTEPSDYTQTVAQDFIKISGSGKDAVWEEIFRTDAYTYANKSYSPPSGTQLPGTYSDFKLSCDTTLAGGIYVIDGGDLEVNASYSLTGNGVMFVLKNGAGMKINGGAAVNLSAMTANELMTAGVSADDAALLEGMLVFEDPDSSGANSNRINGNAFTSLNGVIYTPNSPVELLGSMQGTSACLMIAAYEIQIGGSANLSSFCPPGESNPNYSVNGGTRVRLVA